MPMPATIRLPALLLAVCLMLVFGAPAAVSAQETPKFGFVVGGGGLGDQAFNDMQYNGFVLAQKRFGIEFEVASDRMDNFSESIQELIAKGCTVILGGGYMMDEAMHEMAVRHPYVRFAFLDGVARDLPNMAGVTFRQNEGAFLAGALAALMSEHGRIAMLGGLDIPVIRDFWKGYEAGARFVRPEIKTELAFIAKANEPINPFNIPLRGRRMALDMYEAGTDVIFAVAAATNKGVFVAAKEAGAYAVGVDSDQDYLAQGYILTSVMKRLDKAVLYFVEKIVTDNFTPGNESLGLAEDGVSLTPMTYTRPLIPDEHLQTLEKLKAGIVSGEIQVPSAFPTAR